MGRQWDRDGLGWGGRGLREGGREGGGEGMALGGRALEVAQEGLR